MFNVAEQPWTLLTLAVIVLPIVLMLRRIFPDKKRPWLLLIPLLLAIGAFGLDFLIQTDTEKVKTVIKTAVDAAEQEDSLAIASVVAEDYRDSFHLNKKRLISHCKNRLAGPVIEKNVLRIAEMDIGPNQATITFTVNVLFDEQSYLSEFVRLMLIKMEVRLHKQPDQQWLITRAEILAINRQPAGWTQIKLAR